MPHVLVRFYTNPDGRAARMTSLAVVGLLGVFYLFPTFSGSSPGCTFRNCSSPAAPTRRYCCCPGRCCPGGAGSWSRRWWPSGAIAAFLSTSSGLLVSVAGVLSTDVLRGRVRDFRIAAVLAGVVPLVLALSVTSLDLSRTVGLVFAVAASTLCPLLVLGIWWRGLTAIGAAAGMVVGGVVAGGAALSRSWCGSTATADGWPAVLSEYPAAASVPLAFADHDRREQATRTRIPADVGA